MRAQCEGALPGPCGPGHSCTNKPDVWDYPLVGMTTSNFDLCTELTLVKGSSLLLKKRNRKRLVKRCCYKKGNLWIRPFSFCFAKQRQRQARVFDTNLALSVFRNKDRRH